MSFKIRVKLALVIFILASATALILAYETPQSFALTSHFFKGVFYGLICTVTLFWGIAGLVKYFRKEA